MKTSSVIVGLVAAAPTLAQRPMNTSMCDYYTVAVFNESNAANQQSLITALVNTAVVGNYTMPNVGIKVDGILAPGMVNDTAVNLLPYFNGQLASSNRNNMPTSVNFLDGGGAEPLMQSKAANDESSNQYRLLNHLYQYFGAVLGCSAMDYPAYMGAPSMGELHKFMNLDQYENTWFIQQVGMAAASFGVTDEDVTMVGNLLVQTFNYRCAPAATVIPSQGDQTQSICQAESCPLAENSNCDLYMGSGVEPMNATMTGGSGSGTPSSTSSGSPSGTGTSASGSASPSSTGAASKVGYAVPAGLFALAAFIL